MNDPVTFFLGTILTIFLVIVFWALVVDKMLLRRKIQGESEIRTREEKRHLEWNKRFPIGGKIEYFGREGKIIRNGEFKYAYAGHCGCCYYNTQFYSELWIEQKDLTGTMHNVKVHDFKNIKSATNVKRSF